MILLLLSSQRGVRFLLDQAFSAFFISFSLFSKLIVTISSTSVENTTPRTVNITGFQSRLISGINLNFELLHDPIHTALVLSTLMFRPNIDANCCNSVRHTYMSKMILLYHPGKRLYHLKIVTISLHLGCL